MQTVSFELPDTMIAMLNQLCVDNERVKNTLVKELVIRYLEDVEDGIAARLVIENTAAEDWVSFNDIAKELRLDD